MERGSDGARDGVMEKGSDKLVLNISIMDKIKTHRDLNVFILSFEAGMEIFELTKKFPKEEMYSLTDQIRRSSRSVSGNIAEAFRKRKYSKSFVSKLSDSEGEAAETQVWLDYALSCKYIKDTHHTALIEKYDHIIAMLVKMSINPENWSF
jgi:four helix bundle protein